MKVWFSWHEIKGEAGPGEWSNGIFGSRLFETLQLGQWRMGIFSSWVAFMSSSLLRSRMY